MTRLTKYILMMGLSISVCTLRGQEHSSSSAQTAKIALDVRVQKTVDDYRLHAILTNKEAAPLRIYNIALPWSSTTTMLLASFGIDPHHESPFGGSRYVDFPVPKSYPIEDFLWLDRVVIRAGERLEGSVSLGLRFPALTEMLQKHDVIVFWSYQLKPIKGNPSERFGGWVLIPCEGRKKLP